MPGLPLLVLQPSGHGPTTLVLADLHLGLGADSVSRTAAVDTARQMVEEVQQAQARTHAGRLLVAGDSKHPIVGAPAALRGLIFDFFSDLLSSGLSVGVVLGNHDVGLAALLPREVEVHPSSGRVESGVGIFHGHAWPSAEVLACNRLVVGHLHPGYRFAATADETVPKRRCWVRVRLDAPLPPRQPPDRHPILAEELIVLPAYHPLAGTEALNKERPARGRSFLFQRFLARGACRGYLLDGTDLGPLSFTEELSDRRRGGAAGSGRGP